MAHGGRLEGKVAAITGGASGIGAATVRLFHAEGARVIAADLREEDGERLAAELGPTVTFQRTDVAREADVRALVERALALHGRLDCLFNNAGFAGALGPIEQTPVEEYDLTLDVLLRGVFLGMKHAAPVMKAQGAGSILSTASVAGLQAGFGPHLYSAAKAAVIQLTRSVAMELGESGVRVNCICPGGIVTPLVTRELGEEAVTAVFSELQPIRRAGRPEDVAEVAAWLASDAAGFVTGQALVVDGGLGGGRRWSERPEALRQHRPMRRPGE